jgi:hypothetical protein
MSKYKIIADWEDMNSEDEQPKQYGLIAFETNDWNELQVHLKWMRTNYYDHGYSNFSIEEPMEGEYE